MRKELEELFEKINGTADYSYVDFSEVNATNYLGENALHICVRWGDMAAVKLLVAEGIDINKHGEHGYTPLHEACSNGNAEIVKYLVENGADIFARTEGDLPFTIARLNSNDAICDLLSPHMKKVSETKEPSVSSQHLNALENRIEKLEQYLEEKCDKKSG